MCRKLINAKLNNDNELEVWGDGNQTRSFMYIEDCIVGTKTIFDAKLSEVFNLGSAEQVSINQMIEMIEKISDYKVQKKYLLDKPKGVRGRSSDNTLIKENIDWEPSISLYSGLEKTYKWIYDQIKSGENTLRFTRSY
jgi:nucleoside-diphosphate-sugar epimerase